jgi:AbrB family looped-hinge helix DNA binding protein
MKTLSTTRMSSKGQVVIPEDIRNRLGLGAGSQFVVVGENDVVILKTISHLAMGDFDALIRKARRQAKVSGMHRKDIAEAVSRVRGKR